VLLSAAFEREGIALSWTGQTNSTFHVEAKSLRPGDAWTNISGRLSATAKVITFVDTNSASYQERVYRVISE